MPASEIFHDERRAVAEDSRVTARRLHVEHDDVGVGAAPDRRDVHREFDAPNDTLGVRPVQKSRLSASHAKAPGQRLRLGVPQAYRILGGVPGVARTRRPGGPGRRLLLPGSPSGGRDPGSACMEAPTEPVYAA